jgi:hypothetical protein
MKRFIIILLSIFTLSCQKELVDIDSDDTTQNPYLKFKSIDDVYKTYTDAQSIEELEEYAKNQGINSFYSKSHQIYENLRDDVDYQTIEDLLIAFKKNEKFVELVNEDGEYEAVEKLSYSMFKYFINEDQIFQAGDSIFKVFEDNIVKTDRQNMSEILKLNESDIESIKENREYNLQQVKKISIKKNIADYDEYHNVDKSKSVNGKRVKFEIHVILITPLDAGRMYRIAPQKFILAWFNYNADVTGYLKWRINYTDHSGNWGQSLAEHYIFDKTDDVIGGNYEFFQGWTDSNDIGFIFEAYDGSVTTDDLSGDNEHKYARFHIDISELGDLGDPININ